jgi:uncharacterized membrane protein
VPGEETPETFALFLLEETRAPDQVIDALNQPGLKPTLIASNLSKDQEAALRVDFGEE